MDWEQAVLGTVLKDPETMEEAEILFASDFTGCNQMIWTEMVSLYRRGVLEPRTLVAVLQEKGELDSVVSLDGSLSGAEYLANLVHNALPKIGMAVEKVLGASTKRQLRRAAGLIEVDASDEHISPEDALQNAQGRIMEIRYDRKVEEGVSAGDLMNVFIPRLQSEIDGQSQAKWTPALLAFRNIIDHLEEEDFLVVAARPGEGKSSYMRFEAFESAVRRGEKVMLLNLENSQVEYARSLVSLYTGINSRKFKSAKRLTEAEVNSVLVAAEALSSAPLYIHSMASPSVEQVSSVINRGIMKHGSMTWVGVDYLQLMYNGRDNTVQDVTRSSQGLRAIAKRTKTPIMANAQLSRAIVHRGENAEPNLSDLRESGSIEQDASIISFLREIWPNPTRDQLRTFEQNVDERGNVRPDIRAIPVSHIVKKNRNGPTGRSEPILWDKTTGNMVTLAGGLP